jgi:hypothetical protein
MKSKKLLNEIDYTKSLMGLILETRRSEFALDYPRIESKLKDIEKKTGYKYRITDENIEFEFKNEGGPSVDNGGENSDARRQAEIMTTKMVQLFPELNGMKKIVSSYRSYDEQVIGFIKNLDRDGGPLGRQKWVALPGFSQHHTGRAFDIFSTEPSWWDSRPRIKQWVADNCDNYGFKLSYPTYRGTEYRGAEPWHLFYIGGGSGQVDDLGATDMKTLKSLITSLGYVYKSSIDEAGPLNSKFVGCLKSVIVTLKKEVPEYQFRFGAGRDFWHQNRKGSRHNRGQAVDVTVINKSLRKEDLDKISTVLCAARERLKGFTFIDEYTCPSRGSTGGHYHFSWDPSGSDESRCTPKFCSSTKTKVDSENVSVPNPKDVAPEPLENADDFKGSDVKQPDKVEKLLDAIGLSRLAKMDLDKDGKQFSKEVIDLFGGDEDDVKETDDGDFKIFGYTLSDIIDKAKKLFEHRLNEDINKMKKPLK